MREAWVATHRNEHVPRAASEPGVGTGCLPSTGGFTRLDRPEVSRKLEVPLGWGTLADAVVLRLRVDRS